MYNNSNRYNNRPNQGYGQSRPSLETITPKPLDEHYVQRAEDAIKKLKELEDINRQNRVITTSKLRSLFSLFAETYNEVVRGERETLTPPQVSAMNAARIRVYYEIGREDGYRGNLDSAPVGRFVKYSDLLAYLGDIGDSCDKIVRFYHYMEALVAFHRYYFGEKKDSR